MLLLDIAVNPSSDISLVVDVVVTILECFLQLLPTFFVDVPSLQEEFRQLRGRQCCDVLNAAHEDVSLLFECLSTVAVVRVPFELLAEEPCVFDKGFRVILDFIVQAEHERWLFFNFLVHHSIELFLFLHQ